MAARSGSVMAAMTPVEVAIERLDERVVEHARWIRALLVPHAALYLRLSR
jgi:hypothetical protein